MVSTVEAEGAEGDQKFGFDIVLKKKVQAYIEVEYFKYPEILIMTSCVKWCVM